MSYAALKNSDLLEEQPDQSNSTAFVTVDDILAAANETCNHLLSNFENPDEPYCPPTFDGWSCWNATPANSTAYAPCPAFITGFDTRRFAHKVCTEDGHWFRHPSSNAVWSNYTTCVDVEDLEMRYMIINCYITGYSVSLFALVISLIILCCFQSLKCTRIYIHRNLFASFIINNSLWLIWYKGIVGQPQVVLSNGFACKTLHVILQYFLVSNYFWMFCEGLYLHILLVETFVAENTLMKWFHLIGWIFPALCTIIYTAVRASNPEQTDHCWMEEKSSTWILTGPVCLSMLVNVIFLVNIVRVLVTKLKPPSASTPYVPANRNLDSGRADCTSNKQLLQRPEGDNRAAESEDCNIQDPAAATSRIDNNSRTNNTFNGLRKAVRATLILLPLLGLHYLVMPFRPNPGETGELFYQIVSAIITSFQGLCVAILFCFANGEVRKVVRKEIIRYLASRKPEFGIRRFSMRSHPMTTEL